MNDPVPRPPAPLVTLKDFPEMVGMTVTAVATVDYGNAYILRLNDTHYIDIAIDEESGALSCGATDLSPEHSNLSDRDYEELRDNGFLPAGWEEAREAEEERRAEYSHEAHRKAAYAELNKQEAALGRPITPNPYA